MILRCPECRTRRSTMPLLVRHLRASGHKMCTCGHVSYGGAAFPHRPGSPGCAQDPLGALWMCMRAGEPPEVLLQAAEYVCHERPDVAQRVQRLLGAWGITIDNNVN